MKNRVNFNIKLSIDQIELDFISETESEDDKAMMVKEQNFGMEGFLRTFITLLENKTIVEWFVVSKTKKNLHVDLTWNLYNMKFEGDNIGSEDEPRVQKIVRPLEKLSVGKVVMVDVKESIDFKVNAIWLLLIIWPFL
ncbi:hypothetical protein MHBO_003038 [Bonamia ostreae]|uniref:Uncharacterized protein n=1 Tax=Bonamia ostreae TaxID=126728 RepID=A0ABV2APA4_9EUKA